jgi:hypothetical protein
MNDLIELIQTLTPFTVNRDKLFKFLYCNKITADTLYFKLMTCSRLTRRDYLEEFSDFEIDGIYEEVE